MIPRILSLLAILRSVRGSEHELAGVHWFNGFGRRGMLKP